MRMLLDKLEWPLALALVCGAGLVVQAQDVEVNAPGATVKVGPDKGADGEGVRTRVQASGVDVDVKANSGRIVRIGPDRGADEEVREERIIVNAEPSYWVGILGGDISPELRAHLGGAIKEGEGAVIVREVVPKSPAAEAGLKQHDILLRANGRPITGMNVLVEEVRDVGPSGGQITIDLIRAGKQETVWVKPAERPATPQPVQPGFREPGFGEAAPGRGFFGGLFGGREGEPLRLRMFGPGVVMDGPNVRVLSDGMSVSVATVNGKTRVKVKRGDEEWDIDATDPEALEGLPDDVRALVDGVMAGGNVDVDVNIDEIMPDLEGIFGDRQGIFGRRDGFFGRRQQQQQLQAMQRQIEELQRQLFGEVRPAPEGDAGLDEAPVFEGDARPPAPVNVEIPAEDDGEK